MKRDAITPIKEMGARAPEAGRIRIGTSKPSKNGKKQPVKLKQFRFTTPLHDLADACAVHFGGHVEQWERGQWEVLSTSNSIPVLLLPGGIGQDYELWQGGGLERRCDGETVMMPVPVSDFDYEMRPAPCICGAKKLRECSMKTRIQVLIPALPFAGVWRLDTSGFNAAEELPGMYEMIVALGERGMVQAILSVEERTKVVKTNKGTQTRQFMVPRLSMTQNINELAAGMASVAALNAPAAPAQLSALPPAPLSGPEIPDERWTPPDDGIADAEIVDVELEAAVADIAEYHGLDPERLMTAIQRKAKGDLDNMWAGVNRMKAGELVPLGFYPDGSIQWQG